MVRINFFGDFLCRDTEITVEAGIGRLLSEADLNVANLEAPCIAPGEARPIVKSGPVKLQHPDAPKWLREHGFGVVSLANNHIMDYGELGLSKTLERIPDSLLAVGAGDYKSLYFTPPNLQIIIAEGLRIGFLAYSHHEFGCLTPESAPDASGVAWIMHPHNPMQIQQAKKQCDYLFVLPHAGVEYLEQPLPEWRVVYRSFIDYGADGVFASHPHIVQGWESYKGKPIFYSLGNFFFPGAANRNASSFWSICASVDISADNDQVSVNVTPISFDETTIRLESRPSSQEYIDRINIVLADPTQYHEYIDRACEKLLDHYKFLFRLGGWSTFGTRKRSLKDFVAMMLGRRKERPAHLLNNFRCESHNWAISRALNIKYERSQN